MYIISESMPLKSGKLVNQIIEDANINYEELTISKETTTVDIPFNSYNNMSITDSYHRSGLKVFVKIYLEVFDQLTLENIRLDKKLQYDSAILDTHTYNLMDIKAEQVKEQTISNHHIISAYCIKKLNGELFLYLPIDDHTVKIFKIYELYLMKYFKGHTWINLLKTVPAIIDIQL